MNIKLTRFLDRYIGIPICFLLSLISPFTKRTHANRNSILIIELSEMGSAILLSPIIKQIKKELPDSTVSFLIFKKHRESVEICKEIDHVITIEDRSVFGFLISLPKVIRALRKLKIKFLLDCELFSRISTIISFFSGAENASGFVAPKVSNLYRGKLYTHPFAYNNFLHISENYLGLWKAFFINDQLPYIKQHLRVQNFSTAEIASTKRENLIVFNPHPGLIELRGWPIEHYIELAKLLIAKHRCKIVIAGLENANELAERCCAELGDDCTNLTGKTKSIKELLALYSRAKLLITADSGPAHLAPLANLPAIVLFGPESPIRFAPLGEQVTTISSNIACSPCLSAFNLRDSICGNNICMKKISVETVYEKALKYL